MAFLLTNVQFLFNPTLYSLNTQTASKIQTCTKHCGFNL